MVPGQPRNAAVGILDLKSDAVGANRQFFGDMARDDGDWGPLVQNAQFRALVVLATRGLKAMPFTRGCPSWLVPTTQGEWGALYGT